MPTPPPTDIIVGWLRRLPTGTTPQEIAADTELIERGVLDSIAILDLVSFLEETFRFVLPLDDFVPENFGTAGAIAQMVARLGGGDRASRTELNR
jgi:acyl carrier protein